MGIDWDWRNFFFALSRWVKIDFKCAQLAPSRKRTAAGGLVMWKIFAIFPTQVFVDVSRWVFNFFSFSLFEGFAFFFPMRSENSRSFHCKMCNSNSVECLNFWCGNRGFSSFSTLESSDGLRLCWCRALLISHFFSLSERLSFSETSSMMSHGKGSVCSSECVSKSTTQKAKNFSSHPFGTVVALCRRDGETSVSSFPIGGSRTSDINPNR